MVEEIFKNIKYEIGDSLYKDYFQNLIIKKTENDVVNIISPNQFINKYIQTKYKKLIENEIENFYGKKLKINFFDNTINKIKKTNNKNDNEQISILNPSLVFKSFIVGENNKFAYEVCKASTDIDKFGKYFNPIFIYSKTGLGKTHLLQACGHKCLEHGKKVIYKTSKGFMNDYQNALITNKFEAFNNEYEDCDLLLIDDVQLLGTTEKIQDEFFHIFNHIIQRNGQIIMTSDVAPKDLSGITDRLKSRFYKGIVSDISSPDIDTKRAIIKTKCDVYEINLSDEIIKTIANYIGESIRDLEGIITKIYATYQLTGQKITLEYVKSLIKDYINEKQSVVSVDDILDVVSEELNIKIGDIKSNSKKKEIIKAKRIAVFLSKELTSNSVSAIAAIFNMKDHSAISHHLRKINEILGIDDDFRNLVESIKNKIINSKNYNF